MKRYLLVAMMMVAVFALTACGGSKVIADNEHVKATLLQIDRNMEEITSIEEYAVNMNFENKMSDGIVVQAKDVSINGELLENMIVFHQDVAGESSAEGQMYIMSYQGELPELKGKLEFTLIVADPSTFSILSEQEVSVDL